MRDPGGLAAELVGGRNNVTNNSVVSDSKGCFGLQEFYAAYISSVRRSIVPEWSESSEIVSIVKLQIEDESCKF